MNVFENTPTLKSLPDGRVGHMVPVGSLTNRIVAQVGGQAIHRLIGVPDKKMREALLFAGQMGAIGLDYRGAPLSVAEEPRGGETLHPYPPRPDGSERGEMDPPAEKAA